MGRCERCGAAAATKKLTYHQNIGLLMMRLSRTVDAELCRGCSTHLFFRMTGITFVFGWWGMISMIVSPIFIIGNLVEYAGAMGKPWKGGPVGPVGPAAERQSARPAEAGRIVPPAPTGYVHPNLRGAGPIELEPEREDLPTRSQAAAKPEPVQAAAPEKKAEKKSGAAMTKEEALAALKSYHPDIRMRLKGGDTPEAIAAFIAPRTGLPAKVVRKYVEGLASRGA